MATKTQKKTENINEKIISFYMDYVLTEQKQPASIYAFAKHLGITEAEFYKTYTSFKDIDIAIWKGVAENTINALMASEEFETYNSREKLLGFFYTLVEALNANRSYFIYSLKAQGAMHKNLGEFKEQIENFAKPTIQQGLADKELEERKFISDRYYDAVWVNTLFILNFWTNDNSKGFEKTDAAIEKSVNLMLELMGKSALDSLLDMGKFLLQNGLRK
ncbi:MAG: TetR family transcriptional regulator C-terminal domain-containing protein [bacterium]|nr:TetR family transcriptional regulator C-terminal domain-containing protein [bacterium]